MKKGKLRTLSDGGLAFFCPGYGYYHAVSNLWSFNNDYDNPTFSPSIFTSEPSPRKCHLFIENGKIRYLNDCAHELAGQTIDMKEDGV